MAQQMTQGKTLTERKVVGFLRAQARIRAGRIECRYCGHQEETKLSMAEHIMTHLPEYYPANKLVGFRNLPDLRVAEEGEYEAIQQALAGNIRPLVEDVSLVDFLYELLTDEDAICLLCKQRHMKVMVPSDTIGIAEHFVGDHADYLHLTGIEPGPFGEDMMGAIPYGQAELEISKL